MAPHPLPACVVFDLDGTLVDSAPDLHACIHMLLAEKGLPSLSLELVTSFIGGGIPPLVERSLAAAGLLASPAGLAAAVARYREIYGTAPAAHTRTYSGVADCLAELQTVGVKLAVCTNKAESLARQVIDAVDLGHFFPVIVGGDTLPVHKPDPRPLLLAVDRAGASPVQTVYVGDSEIDAATARAAGIPFALFTLGYRKTSVEALAPALAFDDFRMLASRLGRIGG